MIQQIRPFWSLDQLAEFYAKPYDSAAWAEHERRVRFTIPIAQRLVAERNVQSAVDLSCGDGAILKALDVPVKVFGDICPAAWLDHVGPIEETIQKIDAADLFICTETLEHVEHPRRLLREIAQRASYALISTPESEPVEDNGNWEHYWSWDAGDVGDMIDSVGMRVMSFNRLHEEHYTYQIWTVRTK